MNDDAAPLRALIEGFSAQDQAGMRAALCPTTPPRSADELAAYVTTEKFWR